MKYGYEIKTADSPTVKTAELNDLEDDRWEIASIIEWDSKWYCQKGVQYTNYNKF